METTRIEYPEKWVNAFLEGVKVAEVCQAAGFSRTKYYELKRDPDFLAVLRERRDAMIEAAVAAMRENFLKDVQILQQIAEDDGVSPQIRVNAISVQLSALREWVNITDLQARLEALEMARNDSFSTVEGGMS